MSSQESPPIACTLTSGDFQERLTWIADLNREALLKHNRSDLTLTLVYDRQAIDRVRELMRHEQTCCAFMSFQLDETADMVRLTITAPEEAREAADLLFEQFVPSENQRDLCACGTGAPPPAATSGQVRHRRSMNAVGATALTLGTGALACGACCVLPIAFPAIALAGGGSLLAALASAHSVLMTLAMIAVAIAWGWIGWISLRSKMWPAISTVCLMILATAVLGVAILWPSIEGQVMQALAI
jgi:hypothetical protein